MIASAAALVSVHISGLDKKMHRTRRTPPADEHGEEANSTMNRPPASMRARVRGRGARLALLAAAAVFSAAGCHGTRKQPNVLLVTLDTVRSDHTSLFGYERDTTPALRRLSSAGVTLATAYAPCPVTEPSHLSMLSGLYPVAHGLATNGLQVPRTAPWLPAALKTAGYETCAIVSSFVLDHRFGWNRSFDHFDDRFTPAMASVVVKSWEGFDVDSGALDQRAVYATDKARAWLAGRTAPDAPFFLWVHYFDPHTPYDPPAPYSSAFRPDARDLDQLAQFQLRYDQEILYTDHEVGRLVDAAEKASGERGMLLVVASDHGESFLEHGHVHHGLTVYEEAVRVPVVLRWPGRIPAGLRIAEPVTLVDLAPTVLGLLGIDARLGQDGRDLSAEVTGRAGPPAERPVYLQRRIFRPGATDDLFDPPWARRPVGARIRGVQVGVRLGPWKYIENRADGQAELFDLRADPHERANVRLDEPAVADRLSAQLGEMFRHLGDQPLW